MSNREVVFDIGNVLLRWDPRNLYRTMFDDEAAMEQFLAEALPMSFVTETDIAPDYAAIIEQQVARFPQYAEPLRAFDVRWMECLSGSIAENVALLQRLKGRGERVHALSNFARAKFPPACETYPFLRLFDVAVVSGFEGVAKPDRRIFEILIERIGRRPDELVFIDDSPKNVTAARAFGIDTIQYAPGLDLGEELAAHGVPLG